MFWRIVGGIVLLLWVLGVAYYQARRRGRNIGLAVLLLAGSLVSFIVAAFAPRPPITVLLAQFLIIFSVVLLAWAILIVVLRGFRS